MSEGQFSGSSAGSLSSSKNSLAGGPSMVASSSRRRSSTTSSSSSASTTRTTMTIVRSSRLGASTAPSSPSLQASQPAATLTSTPSSATLRAEFAHGPARTNNFDMQSRTPSPGSPADLQASYGSRGSLPNRQRQHERARSSSYSYHSASSANASSSAMNRAQSLQYDSPVIGSAPSTTIQTSSIPLVSQRSPSSHLNKGKRSSLAGSSRIAVVSEAPIKRSPSSSSKLEHRVSTASDSASVQLPPVTIGYDTSSPASPISPSSPTFEGLIPSRPALPYRIPSFSKSEPVLELSLPFQPSLQGILAEQARLPLTPLEEVNSPLMTLDSPADLAEVQDPFNTRALQEALSVAASAHRQDSDESFYHALLEIIQTEEGYTADLTDLVEVHFNLLAFARFVTEEQRSIIVRNAVQILDIHRRLLAKLQRVEEDLGWIRDHEEPARSSEDESERKSAYKESVRLKSSDATVADAAKRISAIYLNEAQNLSDAYRPFCSGHLETMEITKMLTAQRVDWEAFETHCTGLLASRKSASTRLHFADFLIKPVQRICRYPLLFGNLLKAAKKQEENISMEKIESATSALRVVAGEVDEAQRVRNREIVTVKLALRLDVSSPHTAHLLNHLDQTVLVGSAHVIFTNTSPLVMPQSTPSSSIKANFYGLALYETHLLMIKAKKTNLYEAKHWLPLRLFDLHKVPDGDGQLPYAIKMTYRDYSFEIGSLCHQEQDIWADTIEQTTLACRKKWADAVSAKPDTPVISDDSLICSEMLDPALLWQDAASPALSGAEFPIPSPESLVTSSALSASAMSSDTESGYAPRPRLSLKPPAQRVATDLRLADLLSESVLTARAQSKRSHAMPLHGPPPRSLAAHTGSVAIRRPHSFQASGFSYRNLMEGSSRRSSISESDNARPTFKQILTAGSAGSGSSTSTYTMAGQSDSAPDSRPAKSARSRTSTSGSDMGPPRPARTGTLSRLRRRTASLYQEQAPQKVIAELRQQSQDDRPIISPDSVDAANGTVARNSSTSSSSSCGSNSTNPSHLSSSIETPQSSLPASPLLTPVDLESSTRWTKFGDAITHSLSRKRSFASARPLLAVQPEPTLQGAELQRAQQAAEYIYTGQASGSYNSVSGSHGETFRRPGSSNGPERRVSWDKFGWGRTGSSSSLSTQGYGHRSTLSAPSTRGSSTNLHLSAEKRQSSSGSLWSVFNRDGASYTSSPTPSIYESAHEEDYMSSRVSPDGTVNTSPQELTPTSSPPLAASDSTPLVTSPFVPGKPVRQSSLSPPSTSHVPTAFSGSKMKRSNSISARLRAFRTLGSSMTPLASNGAQR